MEKILATGGMGYIGSHTVVELINAGYDVEILDNLYNSKEEVLDKIEAITGKRPVFHNVDLLNYEQTNNVLKNGFSAVIHFAGYKAVAESVEKPLMYYENNIVGTINLLKVMKENGVNKIVFSSSATVYGDHGNEPFTEDMQTGVGITNPYGQTKYMIEQILKDSAAAYPELSVTILRYFNPIGNHASGLIGEDPNGIPNNLMPIIMDVYRGKREQLQIYGNDYNTSDGTCVRDYIHVVDLAKGHVKALQNMHDGNLAIYNLGSGKGTTVSEMVQAFEKAAGRSLPHVFTERRQGDLESITASANKAKTELDWETELTIEDAMRDTLKFINSEQ